MTFSRTCGPQQPGFKFGVLRHLGHAGASLPRPEV